MSTHTPDNPPPPPPPEDEQGGYGPGSDYSTSAAPQTVSESMREPVAPSPSSSATPSGTSSVPYASEQGASYASEQGASYASQQAPSSYASQQAPSSYASQPATSSASEPATQAMPGREAGNQPSAAAVGPRRVRLAVSRVDPWSAMKLSFLLSFALGIILVVASAVVWFALDSMMVFASVEELLESIGSEALLELMQYVEFDRILSFATIVAVFNVLLLTALGTVMAFLYNIIAALVGGLHLTLTDD